jgi:hypothetical protein
MKRLYSYRLTWFIKTDLLTISNEKGYLENNDTAIYRCIKVETL